MLDVQCSTFNLFADQYKLGDRSSKFDRKGFSDEQAEDTDLGCWIAETKICSREAEKYLSSILHFMPCALRHPISNIQRLTPLSSTNFGGFIPTNPRYLPSKTSPNHILTRITLPHLRYPYESTQGAPKVSPRIYPGSPEGIPTNLPREPRRGLTYQPGATPRVGAS